jgi:hypothetical protein
MAERIFYHLTAKRNLASIMKSGLMPRRGPRARSHLKGEERKAVYLFLEMWNALHALDNMYGDEFDEELVLLQVRLEGNVVQVEEDQGQAVRTSLVPPAALSVAADGLWSETFLDSRQAEHGQVSRLQYHVTPRRNLKRILKEGLRVRQGMRSRKMAEGRGIFLFATRQAAETGAANWLGDEFADGTRLALLKVLVPQEAAIAFDPAVGYESCIDSDVPPDHVQVVSEDF